jgi:hypothetical protein
VSVLSSSRRIAINHELWRAVEMGESFAGFGAALADDRDGGDGVGHCATFPSKRINVVKPQDDVCHTDDISSLEFGRADAPHSVHTRATAASHLFNAILSMSFNDYRVIAADRNAIQQDLARRMSPHHHPPASKF